MEPNIQNSSGMMNGMPPAPKNPKKVGPVIGALVVVLIIIIVVLYFFGQRLNSPAPAVNSMTVSSSTETNDLDAELDAQMKDVDYSF